MNVSTTEITTSGYLADSATKNAVCKSLWIEASSPLCLLQLGMLIFHFFKRSFRYENNNKNLKRNDRF